MANKFDWLASDSAPKGYPMEIVRGYFYMSEDDQLYIPSGKTLYHGWGEGVSVHVVGDETKLLPRKMSITFFSYTENKFYQGEFELPYDKILALFSHSYYSYKTGDNENYNEIIAGVAPGGHVSVWVNGIDKTTEVFSGQAQEVELDWKQILDNPDIPRDQFIKEEIEESLKPEELEALKKNGVPLGLWETYRKRYHWQPLFTGFDAPAVIERVIYFNGEDEYLYYPLDKEHAGKPLPIPDRMFFDWEYPRGLPLAFKLYFNEKEIFNAFEKLGSHGESLKLEMRMSENDKGQTFFYVLLKNDKEEVLLSNTKLKTYGIPKKK